MGNRDQVLENVRRACVNEQALPALKKISEATFDVKATFTSVLERIGGKSVEVNGWEAVARYVRDQYSGLSRIISTLPELAWFVPQLSHDPHTFEAVDLSILRGHFGVAENGAVWITDKIMGDRSIPFISQHLALVINKKDIVPTLVEAMNGSACIPTTMGRSLPVLPKQLT